ncbi:hypothetical protein HYALB_00013433 [Hymenoscyphus albidus]|uniref:N-acetyltransferase domain-containing protein n=1 Tax=Hymenoscyphus albidus TaxID=595503 RepID=A0A9N9Q4I1_9HELO|nr:hypothetical protein HYALB_00013433 [Hymenoscyphus albidus]
MALQLSDATLSDVDQIASLHLASFDSNPLLHVQFPTPESLASLHSVLILDMKQSIESEVLSKNKILVVKDTKNQIISFAKWDLPAVPEESHFKPEWHQDVQQEYLNRYYNLAEAAKQRVIGNTPCYRLTFVGTHPNSRGQGAATLLTKWGLSRAKEENIPVYLESTLPASPFYRKFGFVAQDGLALPLPKTKGNSSKTYYEEICMLRTWDADSDDGLHYWDSSLNISSLQLDYEAGIKPQQVVEAVYERIDAYQMIQSSVWLYLRPLGDAIRAANELLTRWPDPDKRPPLWGVPFSVKDSIDVAGIPTTNCCPIMAKTPEYSAPVFQQCIDAGGIFIGKTNMEQLATGMTGCRSPFGTLHSTFSKSHIVGGSSSGSAVSVGQQLVGFSLGSDTAGSIRIPAVFNGIVGFKPTKGTVSACGVCPASKHQDCVSFLASTVEDSETIWKTCRGFDKNDHFAKRIQQSSGKESLHNFAGFRFGVPPDTALEQCSDHYRRKFAEVVEVLKSTQNGAFSALDWTPFAKANDLLYSSSFVLERLTIFPDDEWFGENKQHLHPVTRQVFEGVLARKSTAVDVFRDLHKQAEYVRAVEDILTLQADDTTNEKVLTVMVVPTAPFHPAIEQVNKDPLAINAKLGAFAHFANVLDLVGIALPCGTYEVPSEEEGERSVTLPFGVTILAGSGCDQALLRLAMSLEESLGDLHDD